ncbi:urea amidolyase associated protein UAAP1 [Rhodococcus sp. 14-1411-2a]|uniref:urea amidolyase associated protein UAAP1 n=1 Tax=Rhodococcus sp. 14-1411-2a TaxID=2023151 RepID=UPI000B9A32EE|nr:urea amidolyase associated protein UAAP1 [Rhodococcus sp. 14-1411-2a]OZF49892.1 urea carboxylase [Rhodococcus sp. 14-1411-2a]
MSTATATTHSAKEHARSQATVAPAPTAPEGISELTWAESVPGGSYTTKVLARGTRLRLVDVDGDACANLLLYRADAPWERLNTADTVKVPWQAYLSAGHPLLSDQGRVLATIVDDTSGHHDALCGTTSAATNTAKYGVSGPHSSAPAGRELFTLAAAKHGLEPRDVAPSLSFFHGVRVDADGALVGTGSAGAGKSVDLLIHLPVIVLLANTAHPLDPRSEYPTTALDVLAWRAPEELLALGNTEPEYQRAVQNTEDAWKAAQ